MILNINLHVKHRHLHAVLTCHDSHMKGCPCEELIGYPDVQEASALQVAL